MSVKENLSQLAIEFDGISDWEEKYRKLIAWGKSLEELPEEFKVDDLKVRGCQSQVWLKSDFKDNKVYFKGDSDALIVKGLLSLILSVYSGRKPQEILDIKPDFLEELGLKQHLSSNRSNGVLAMIKQIYYYAQAYLLLEKQSK